MKPCCVCLKMAWFPVTANGLHYCRTCAGLMIELSLNGQTPGVRHEAVRLLRKREQEADYASQVGVPQRRVQRIRLSRRGV